MPHPVRNSLLLILFSSLIITGARAQQKNIAPTPIPDFSRSVDLTEYRPFEYQEFEKTPLTFSSKAQYVLVPAVVTDKEGKPITGLKKEDFHLQENGKDQLISSVDEIVPTAAPVNNPPIPNKPNAASNELAIANRAPPRLVIVALDMVNTPSRSVAVQAASDRLSVKGTGA